MDCLYLGLWVVVRAGRPLGRSSAFARRLGCGGRWSIIRCGKSSPKQRTTAYFSCAPLAPPAPSRQIQPHILDQHSNHESPSQTVLAGKCRPLVMNDKKAPPLRTAGQVRGGKAKPHIQPRRIAAYRDSSSTSNERGGASQLAPAPKTLKAVSTFRARSK